MPATGWRIDAERHPENSTQRSEGELSGTHSGTYSAKPAAQKIRRS